jgi:integrase
MSGCRALNPTEIELVTNQLTNPRDRALFILGVRSGFRISELLSLRVSDVFANGRVLDVARVVRRNTKGAIASRTIPIHQEARKALLEICVGREGSHPLFQSRNGVAQAISRFMAHKILKAAYASAGLEGPGLACHTMRKSFSEKVYAALNFDLLATSAALGHRDIRNTVRYLEPNKDKIKAAILA